MNQDNRLYNRKTNESETKNVKLSKLETVDIAFENIDVKNFSKHSRKYKLMKHNVKRIIMNLPEKNLEFIQFLSPFISDSGTLLHIYQFNEKDKIRFTIDQLRITCFF